MIPMPELNTALRRAVHEGLPNEHLAQVLGCSVAKAQEQLRIASALLSGGGVPLSSVRGTKDSSMVGLIMYREGISCQVFGPYTLVSEEDADKLTAILEHGHQCRSCGRRMQRQRIHRSLCCSPVCAASTIVASRDLGVAPMVTSSDLQACIDAVPKEESRRVGRNDLELITGVPDVTWKKIKFASPRDRHEPRLALAHAVTQLRNEKKAETLQAVLALRHIASSDLDWEDAAPALRSLSPGLYPSRSPCGWRILGLALPQLFNQIRKLAPNAVQICTICGGTIHKPTKPCPLCGAGKTLREKERLCRRLLRKLMPGLRKALRERDNGALAALRSSLQRQLSSHR